MPNTNSAYITAKLVYNTSQTKTGIPSGLNIGDIVLLTAQDSKTLHVDNGLWQIAVGNWERVTNAYDTVVCAGVGTINGLALDGFYRCNACLVPGTTKIAVSRIW